MDDPAGPDLTASSGDPVVPETSSDDTAGSDPTTRDDTAAGGPDRRSAWLDRGVLVAIFVVTRIAYSAAGVGFDSSSLLYSSQLLDQTWLRDRWGESLLYLHAQPPLFNAFVGLVLRWSPIAPDTTFQVAYLALGLVLLLAAHDLGRRLGLGRVAAAVVAVVVCASPTVVLYESWLSYEMPVAVALVVLVDLAVRYGRSVRPGLLIGAVAVASAVVLTRSLMSPVWLVAVVACLVAYRRPRWSTLGWVAVPLVLVGAVMVKNQVLFGTPQLSSWFGYNLDKVATSPLTDDQKRQLADEGFVRTDPGPCVVTRTDVPALADHDKPTAPPAGEDPIENFNHECLVARYEALQTDALHVARAHPGWVARNMVGGAEIWSSPSSLSPFVYGNRQAVATLDDVDRRVVLLDVAWDPPVGVPTAWPVGVSAPDRRFHVSITLLVATAAVSLAALVSLLRWRRRDATSLAFAVGGMTVAYVAVVGSVFEYGENNRIRFVTEPLTLVLFAVLLVAGWRAGQRWWRRRADDRPAAEAA